MKLISKSCQEEQIVSRANILWAYHAGVISRILASTAKAQALRQFTPSSAARPFSTGVLSAAVFGLLRASQLVLVVKHLPVQETHSETQVRFLELGWSPGKRAAAHSALAQRIPWTGAWQSYIPQGHRSDTAEMTGTHCIFNVLRTSVYQHFLVTLSSWKSSLTIF